MKFWLTSLTPSEAVSVTEYGLLTDAPAAMVPSIVPVRPWTYNPGGSPVALKVSWSASGSLAVTGRETVSFSLLVCMPGFVSEGGRFVSVMVQVKDCSLEKGPSLAVMGFMNTCEGGTATIGVASGAK